MKLTTIEKIAEAHDFAIGLIQEMDGLSLSAALSAIKSARSRSDRQKAAAPIVALINRMLDVQNPWFERAQILRRETEWTVLEARAQYSKFIKGANRTVFQEVVKRYILFLDHIQSAEVAPESGGIEFAEAIKAHAARFEPETDWEALTAGVQEESALAVAYLRRAADQCETGEVIIKDDPWPSDKVGLLRQLMAKDGFSLGKAALKLDRTKDQVRHKRDWIKKHPQ